MILIHSISILKYFVPFFMFCLVFFFFFINVCLRWFMDLTPNFFFFLKIAIPNIVFFFGHEIKIME